MFAAAPTAPLASWKRCLPIPASTTLLRFMSVTIGSGISRRTTTGPAPLKSSP